MAFHLFSCNLILVSYDQKKDKDCGIYYYFVKLEKDRGYIKDFPSSNNLVNGQQRTIKFNLIKQCPFFYLVTYALQDHKKHILFPKLVHPPQVLKGPTL